MSEKIYTFLLSLLAPHFHCEYGNDAIQLFHDRSRDEQGFVAKLRFWLDLLSDLAVCVARDHQFASHRLIGGMPGGHLFEGIPSFHVVRGEPPGAVALLLGTLFSLVALGTLPLLVSHGGHGGRPAVSIAPLQPSELTVPIPMSGERRELGHKTGTLVLNNFSTGSPQYADRFLRQTARSELVARFGFPAISAVNEYSNSMQAKSKQPRDAQVTLASARNTHLLLMSAFAEAIDPAERKRVIDGVIANLREHYVYPNVAQQMIDALIGHEKAGDYEQQTDGNTFAALLTKQLQDGSHDLHLRVAYSAAEVPDHPRGPEGDARFRSMLKRENCGFRKVEVLPHNIGYVKFDGFGPLSLCRDTGAAAMQFLAHVDGLIFDLRENHGGDPHMVSFMASYLFDRRTHLNDIYNPSDKSTEEFWTAEDVGGPKFGKTPVYVLTSAATFSGGEEFAYDLKNLKRAVIVGETTGGGAHLVMMHRIDAHFTIGVPFARPINPISKTDWERTGVVPDAKVKAADALEAAERLAESKLERK